MICVLSTQNSGFCKDSKACISISITLFDTLRFLSVQDTFDRRPLSSKSLILAQAHSGPKTQLDTNHINLSCLFFDFIAIREQIKPLNFNTRTKVS